MKPLLFGAVLALLWLVSGIPLTVPAALVATLLQPVTVAFAAGLLVPPHLSRRGWSR